MSAKKAAKKTATKKAPPAQPAPKSELASAIAAFNKAKGTDAIQTASRIKPVKHIPTGIFILDLALCGGIPENKASMFFGKESGGKSTILLKSVAEYHRKYHDKHVVWVDSEKLFDPLWARQLGCDLDRLLVITPETGEEAVDAMANMMEPIEVGWVILDSIPGCVPKAMMDRSAEDKTMGVLAALMGLMCSKILGTWGQERRRGHEVTVSFVNQIRMKLGLVFGSPETLPGGRQVNHLAVTKVKVNGKEKKGEDSRGNSTKISNEITFHIEKAKDGASLMTGVFTLNIDPEVTGMPAGSVDEVPTVLTFAEKFGLLTGAGSHYSCPLLFEGTMEKKAIKSMLRRDDFKLAMLKAALIILQRAAKGLNFLPLDRYLVAPGAVDALPDWVMEMAEELVPSFAEDAPDEAGPDDEDEEEDEAPAVVRRRVTVPEDD